MKPIPVVTKLPFLIGFVLALGFVSTARAGKIEMELDPQKNPPGLYSPEGGTAKGEKRGNALHVDYDRENALKEQDWFAIQLKFKEPIQEKDRLKKISFKIKTSAKDVTVNVRGGSEMTLTGFNVEKPSKTEKTVEIDVEKILKDRPEKKTWTGAQNIVYPIVVVTFSFRVEKEKGFIEISDLVLETQ